MNLINVWFHMYIDLHFMLLSNYYFKQFMHIEYILIKFNAYN